MFAKYFTCYAKQKTDREARQDNKSAREESEEKWKLTEIIAVMTMLQILRIFSTKPFRRKYHSLS